MADTSWAARILAGTRGQLIALLRRQTRTVDELARDLHVTDNAVRAHLAALERDGLVRRRGVLRSGGSGKPAYTYALTDEAEQLFPKAYGPVLCRTLDVLAERLPAAELEALVREVGRQIAAEHGALPLDTAGDVKSRLALAVDALNALGGLAELEERDGARIIRGYSCPLAAVVPGHPEICRLAEALLTEVCGMPVHEQCERGEPPHCCFTVASA